jgi:cytochrome c2
VFENAFRIRAVWRTAVVAVCVFSARGARCQTEAEVGPFVAGFDRFARHGEVETDLAGKLLLTELSCSACHHTIDEELKPKRGPKLDGVGNRVSREWIARLLDSPQKAKPGTTMPDALAGLDEGEKAKTVEALVAFLATLQQPFPEIKGTGARPVPLEFWDRGLAARGRQLYHQIGCVACHAADESYETVETKPTSLDELLKALDPDELKELGLSSAARRVQSVPHGDLAAKYSHKSLTFFLLDPHSVRPGGRMPNFQLPVDEAADIAAWLLRDQSKSAAKSVPAESDEKLVELGKRLFVEHGCANCHSVLDVPPGKPATPLALLSRASLKGCFGPPAKGRPRFPLDDVQTKSVTAALKSVAVDAFAKQVPNPVTQVQLQMLKMNCLACHERAKLGGVGRYRKAFFETVGHVDIGDEGRLPPPLTGVGSKLLPAWTTKVLLGTAKLRPYMRIRMPAFPKDEVKSLPARLTQADFRQSKPQPTEQEVFGDQAGLAESGRLLLDTGCVQCHPLRGESLPGVVGIDLAGISSRVHPKWFHDFLLNPAELKPRTRMPTFFPGGKSQNAGILEGNAERQIAAMWVYLKDLNRQKLPPKIEKARSRNYELAPKDRPIILRTFMEEAGTHAVAVGFPQKVHFAFDAEQMYPAFAWRGRFLDARGTWFERFTPPANPLTEGGVRLPSGVALADSLKFDKPWPNPADASGYQYLGHRLDKNGIPTFRYKVEYFVVEDRITPEGKGLLRELTITDRINANARSLNFLAQTGRELKRDGASCTNEAGLKVTMPAQFAKQGRIRNRGGRSEWGVSVFIDRKRKLEVRYEW